MPTIKSLQGSTAYEKRLLLMTHQHAKAVFDKQFAADAFRQGKRKKRVKGSILTKTVIKRISSRGHGELAMACLAYVLSRGMAHRSEDKLPFRKLIMTIRDCAKVIGTAADELAAQLQRYDQENIGSDRLRLPALTLMASAVHGQFYSLVEEASYMDIITPKLIEVPLSDNAMTHGLSGLARLYDEANTILKTYDRNQHVVARYGRPTKKRGAHSADHERDAFIRDLAKIYVWVLQQDPSAWPIQNGDDAPFMRFVHRVYQELCSQTLAPLPPEFASPPPWGTVRRIF